MHSIIYCRVSSKEQNNDSQVFMCNKFCEEKGLNVLKVFTETGCARDIEKLDSLMDILYEFKNVNLVVYSVDRLCRNAEQGKLLYASLESKNINVVSITDSSLYSSFEKFSVSGEVWYSGMLYAQHESDLISQRIKRSVLFRKAKGDHIGNPSYGRKIVWIDALKTTQTQKATDEYKALGPAPKCMLDIINSKDTPYTPYERKGCYNKRYLAYNQTESKVVRFIKAVTHKKFSTRNFNEILTQFQETMGLLKRPVSFYKEPTDNAEYDDTYNNAYVCSFSDETSKFKRVRSKVFIGPFLVAQLLNELNIDKRGKSWTGLKVKSVLFL